MTSRKEERKEPERQNVPEYMYGMYQTAVLFRIIQNYSEATAATSAKFGWLAIVPCKDFTEN